MTKRAVVRDERGAIMIVALFFAVFMTGLLFYSWAVSESVLLQARLQDSSDVAAAGAAIVHARGMNLLVLLNQTMAALLSVLIGLRLTEMLSSLALALASALSFVPGVASVVPPLTAVQQSSASAYASLEEPIHTALAALHDAELAVKDVTPGLAVGAYASNAAGLGVAVVPTRATLPVESDAFSVLCDRAGEDAASIAMAPLEALGLPSALAHPVEEELGNLSASASDWFCGKSGTKAPRMERNVERVLPMLTARAACERAATSTQSRETLSACQAVDPEESNSDPGSSGECREACGPDGPYEERVQKAREQCDPRTRAGLHGFQWSERTVHARLTQQGVYERTYEGPVRVIRQPKTSYVVPCGLANALYASAYQLRVHPSGGGRIAPVCQGHPRPMALGGSEMEFVEVLNVFQCVVTEKKVIEIGDKSNGARGSPEESPMRMLPDLQTGSDDFQLRSVCTSRTAETWAERVVAVPAYSRNVDPAPLAVTAFGPLAIAEAEYGFDGAEPASEWMWARSWTAHLSRVRAPENAQVKGALIGGCELVTSASKSCLGVSAALGPFSAQVAH